MRRPLSSRSLPPRPLSAGRVDLVGWPRPSALKPDPPEAPPGRPPKAPGLPAELPFDALGLPCEPLPGRASDPKLTNGFSVVPKLAPLEKPGPLEGLLPPNEAGAPPLSRPKPPRPFCCLCSSLMLSEADDMEENGPFERVADVKPDGMTEFTTALLLGPFLLFPLRGSWRGLLGTGYEYPSRLASAPFLFSLPKSTNGAGVDGW